MTTAKWKTQRRYTRQRDWYATALPNLLERRKKQAPLQYPAQEMTFQVISTVW